MHTYRLTPLRTDSEEWGYSTCCDPVQALAENETDARYMATMCFAGGAKSALGFLTSKSPWGSKTLVKVEMLRGPDPGVPLLRASQISWTKARATAS